MGFRKIFLLVFIFIFLFNSKVYCFVVKFPFWVSQGSGFWIYIKKERGDSLNRLCIYWLNKRIFVPYKDKTLKVILGAGLERRGDVPLKIIGYDGRRIKKRAVVILRIRKKNFPKRCIKLPKKMVYPPKKVIGRILKEQKNINSILNRITKKIYYKGFFLTPVKGKVIVPFGVVRFLNGIKRSVHKGVDFRAPFNTLVRCSNYGKVVFTGDLYFGGRTIIVDHGLGVFSIYMHLNKFLVKRGEFVKKGKIIALSGASGRVTGPHLHFGLTVLGERINPFSLIRK